MEYLKENEHITCQFEEYAQLISLICGHIPNEEFEKVTQDLLNITDNLVRKDVTRFGKNLKTWESIVCCNLNPIKTKTLSNAIEGLLPKLMVFLQESIYDENLFNTIYEFERIMIQTNHVHLSPHMIDILILNSTLFMQKENKNFKKTFILSISLLDCLLRHRKPMIMDRLPPFLQQFRVILKSLCQKSNSDLSLEDVFVREISDCAHELEKFTRNLVYCQKDMGRIAMYLIADILEQYEKTTLYPGVKIHLNNCVYSLISVCDQHAVTYLMRVLSSASTEIFKLTHTTPHISLSFNIAYFDDVRTLMRQLTVESQDRS
ncbi:hypothetical protein NQ317_010330 [Molorchus minor]|uniref:Nucleolar 27S pre-rRNA processing Urb2/Npa2 C-terminal domain-containing protein n=1 Tax=Molorchus minor TaxID=1323400 RepID=A0ABQ9J4C6_9CUCU|nr:hypothetical protein NQ317_010330 [Molorchus minor]